jgi:Lar family restriction alleviation protein
MTDKRIKEPCPFCGTKAEEIQIRHFKDGINKIKCPNCNVTFEGAYSKQEIIDKWNGRYK